MPVSNFTYVYLILTITDILYCLIAALRKDEEKFIIFFLAAHLLAIGFFCNRYAIQSV